MTAELVKKWLIPRLISVNLAIWTVHALQKVVLYCFWVPREINWRFYSKTQWQMFLLVSGRHVGAHPDGHQHGVSIQSSVNLVLPSFLWHWHFKVPAKLGFCSNCLQNSCYRSHARILVKTDMLSSHDKTAGCLCKHAFSFYWNRHSNKSSRKAPAKAHGDLQTWRHVLLCITFSACQTCMASIG